MSNRPAAAALAWLAISVLALAPVARGAIGPDLTQKLYDDVTPSLVAVKFTWENELGRRELVGAGIVVRDDGLIMCQLGMLDPRIFPDEQLTKFQVIVPDRAGGDPAELDAKLLGRDERYNVAFVQPSEPKKDNRSWTPIKFEDVEVKVGEPVLSVGMLPEMAAYKAYVIESSVAATLRGEQPQVLVQSGLAPVSSPVFNAEGKAIGVVMTQFGQTPFINAREQAAALNAINNPPRFFLPARDFLPAIAEPPTEGKPVPMPWLGVTQMTGLNKDVAEVYGLENQPAVQIGDVIPDAPAGKGGLKRGDIIVKLDGKPLERGDEADELPQILRRQIARLPVGQKLKLGVIRAKGEQPQDIEITTAEMPPRPHTAKRWYAEDLGFSSREIVFTDTYNRRLKSDAKGVIVSLIRPQSSAQTGGLQMEDLITELNRQPVENLEQFRKVYEEFRKSKPKEAVVMVVLREGNTQTIRIEPPQ